MQLLGIIALLLAAFACACFAAPADIKDSPKDAQSAFGQPFDEIVVDTSLTVKRKTGARQSRNKDVTNVSASVSGSKREKRQFRPEASNLRYNPLPPL